MSHLYISPSTGRDKSSGLSPHHSLSHGRETHRGHALFTSQKEPRMATILIVDDEQDCRRPLATLLGHEGYRIVQAADGLEGLARLREEKVDLILLDMIMPGVDGLAML